ncbi:metal-chelation protein CHAD (plasmid) [Pseudomonas veronii 1YdBTEX2]|uniref:Metal-chelation protein CHAD n=2 Tax=Pseudomonas veronii TaxID=76761 RepID=A0A1D3KAU8_PSEVE|nr:CHAD domain-containing protein [Pseudomonas veronii]SBW84002.1 metal-chelation protein CHAD [Pseudomonas veronii 1YdBTEX2]SBW85427.1 metal-chelation protein CHAD [Pseudomonas veronii 1YdBTEX2]
MAFVDSFVAQIVAVEVALYHAHARMNAKTDSEALHDLRINLRRIRSLLRPLREIEGITPLNEAAAEVGRLTTPERDLEVLIEELEAQGFTKQANVRKANLQTRYSRIVKSRAVNQLFSQLDEWPPLFRTAERAGALRNIKKQITKRLHKQVERLKTALADPQFDRHQLRILVKRTRYLNDAFPQLSPLSGEAAASLKTVQTALGSWHDHFQWCLKARHEKDLQPLAEAWHAAAETALLKAEAQLAKLLRLLATKKRLPQRSAENKGLPMRGNAT